jgi:DeoR family transcriptional regulator, fructose operon transcriptional repressor
MQAEERRTRLADYLRRKEFASLDELAREVAASPSTVRRDLMALEATGAFRRTHGGARLVSSRTEEFAFATRRVHEAEEKEQMGAACAGLLSSRQSLILDAGSTVFHVANHLEHKEPQIFTNSLPVANLFASSSLAEVIISGGVLYPRLGVLVGPLAERAFSEIHADVAIMGGSGITMDGIYNSHALLIGIQRAMLAAAEKVIFCLDHSKFGRKSMARVCGLEEVHCIVTDSRAPVDLVEGLRDRGIDVVVAQEEAAPAAR